MIAINLVFDDDGLLMSCRITGHAGAGKRGEDIVCAAVSVLARTAVLTLSGREGIDIRSDAPGRGDFWLETGASGRGKEFLSAVGAFLEKGFSSVAEEYPEYCTLTLQKERRK